MHVAARVGIAAVTAGATGFGMYKLIEGGSDRVAREGAELDREVAKQGAAWDSWSAKLEAEFPGRRLETPADHARFEQFLRDNPAPSWVKVDHADYTRARLSIGAHVVPRDLQPDPELAKGIGYGAVGAIGSALMGGGMAIAGLKGAGGSAWSNLGMLVGGTAMATAGVGMIPALFAMGREGGNDDRYVALMDHAEMQ